MEIRFSKYNSPFCEPSILDVHYISLDDQRDLKAGFFDAHVRAFYSSAPSLRLSRTFRTFRTDNVMEVFDPLSGTTRFHDLSDATFFMPGNSSRTVNDIDLSLADQLRKSRVKAAVPAMSLCKCGNANRPWRCKCNP